MQEMVFPHTTLCWQIDLMPFFSLILLYHECIAKVYQKVQDSQFGLLFFEVMIATPADCTD